MKVSINNQNKPLPFFGLIGSIAAAGINASNQSSMNAAQMKHDKEMAEINQANVLEQMETQNQYQVEQWNRENAYNDPTSVRARYEAAGISAHSALGGAATGAGIAGGLSSAPSGSSTGHSSSLRSADIGTPIAQASSSFASRLLEKQSVESDVANTNADTQGKLIDNLTRASQNLANLQLTLARFDESVANKNRTESQIKSDDSYRDWLAQQIEQSKEQIKLLQDQQNTEQKRAENLSASTTKTNEETKQLKVESEWIDKFGFKPGATWSSVLAAIYARGKNTEQDIVDNISSLQGKFSDFIKKLFSTDVSEVDAKEVLSVVKSSKNDEQKIGEIKKILKKSDYNWFNE